LLTLMGLAWGLVFPINKKIWTSSYVLYTSGLAALVIGVMIYYVEGHGVKNAVTKFFDVFGKNPLFIFVLSGLLPKTLGLLRWQTGLNDAGNPIYTTPLRWFYTEVCAKFPGPPEYGSFLYALCFLALCWSIAYWMDKKKIYVKV
jgi:predicted acyltransferase